MNRRSFLSLFGSAAAVAAVKPTYFFAPVGGWKPRRVYSFSNVNGIYAPETVFMECRLEGVSPGPLLAVTWDRSSGTSSIQIYRHGEEVERDYGRSATDDFASMYTCRADLVINDPLAKRFGRSIA